jgi:hypothetical protein
MDAAQSGFTLGQLAEECAGADIRAQIIWAKERLVIGRGD